jgi:hypothetical protein
MAARMIKKQNVSTLFGPVCGDSAVVVGGLFKKLSFFYLNNISHISALAAYTNTAVFLWTTLRADFRNTIKYPTVFNAAGTLNGLVTATANVLNQYNWTEVGFVFSTTDTAIETITFCIHYAR